MFLKIFWKRDGKDLATVLPIDKAIELVQKIQNQGISTSFEVDIIDSDYINK